jgi:hypothetical protein
MIISQAAKRVESPFLSSRRPINTKLLFLGPSENEEGVGTGTPRT